MYSEVFFINNIKYNEKYYLLTKKQREVYDFMVNNYKKVSYMTLKELSKMAETSEVTVLKVCKKLGYGNYIGLKKAFQNFGNQNLSFREIQQLVDEGTHKSKSQKEDLFRIICNYEQQKISDMINDIDVELISKCAKALLESKEVIVFGHNASKTLADYFTHRLNYLRVKAYSVKLGDDSILKSALARIDKQSFAVFFSFPPYHFPTVDLVKFIEMKGSRIITITHDMNSPAISDEGYNFIFNTQSLFFYNGLSIPMKFIELLASSMAIELGQQFEEIIKEELFISRFINER